MSTKKTETLTFRVEAHVKSLLKIAACRENRSLANMLKVMIIDYCIKNNIEIFNEETPK